MRGFDSDNAWQDFGRVVGRTEAIESHRAPTGQRINLKVQKRASGKRNVEALGESSATRKLSINWASGMHGFPSSRCCTRLIQFTLQL